MLHYLLPFKAQPGAASAASWAFPLPNVRSIRAVQVPAPRAFEDVHSLIVVVPRKAGLANHDLRIPVLIARRGCPHAASGIVAL